MMNFAVLFGGSDPILGVSKEEWCSWWISEAWDDRSRKQGHGEHLQVDDPMMAAAVPMPRSTPPKPTRL